MTNLFFIQNMDELRNIYHQPSFPNMIGGGGETPWTSYLGVMTFLQHVIFFSVQPQGYCSSTWGAITDLDDVDDWIDSSTQQTNDTRGKGDLGWVGDVSLELKRERRPTHYPRTQLSPNWPCQVGTKNRVKDSRITNLTSQLLNSPPTTQHHHHRLTGWQ
jgi:hypothetical protein